MTADVGQNLVVQPHSEDASASGSNDNKAHSPNKRKGHSERYIANLGYQSPGHKRGTEALVFF